MFEIGKDKRGKDEVNHLLSGNGLDEWCIYHLFEKGEGLNRVMKESSVGEVTY
jgi:hypothetical protein